MDENITALFLRSLKTVLSHPALRGADDEAVKAQIALADPLIAGMLARTAAPALLTRMRDAYLALLPELEAATGDDEALRRFRTSLDASPPRLDDMLRAVVEVQAVLRERRSPAFATLSKKLVGIERDYSNGIDIAYRAALAPEGDGSDASGATHAKAYDEGALCHFMRSAFAEESALEIRKSSFISGGYSKYTMGIELSGNRVLPSSVILRADATASFGGSSVVDEYGLLKAVYDSGVCVPKPFALDASGESFGSPFLLVERRPGRSIGHMFHLPAPNANISRDIAARLAEIHQVPLDALPKGLRGTDKTSTQYALDWIEDSYAKWRALDTPGTLMDTAFRWLRDNVHMYDGQRTLVHGDFALHNQLIDGEKVSAILDWEFAHVGNPVYDLGYFYYQAVALAPWQTFIDAYAAAGGLVPEQRALDYATLLAEVRLTTMTRQYESAYYAGAPLGLAGAISAASGFRNMSDARIAAVLEKVL